MRKPPALPATPLAPNPGGRKPFGDVSAASQHGIAAKPSPNESAPSAPSASSAPAASCGEEVCLTCSDEAVEVRVTKLLDDAFAMVETGQARELVSVALVDASVGDTVLVHAKEAIGVVRRAGV